MYKIFFKAVAESVNARDERIDEKSESYAKKIYEEMVKEGVVRNKIRQVRVYLEQFNEKDDLYSDLNNRNIDDKVRSILGEQFELRRITTEVNEYNTSRGFGIHGSHGDGSKDYVIEYFIKW